MRSLSWHEWREWSGITKTASAYHVVLAVKDEGADTLAAVRRSSILDRCARRDCTSAGNPARNQLLETFMDTPNTDHLVSDGTVARITAQVVDDARRLRTLPHYFGNRMMRFEAAVFDWMHRIAADYRGGFWQFYTLSNGGFYMAPDRGSYRLIIDTNSYEGVMSADAAGITTCLFACSHLSFHDSKGELFAERFHQLRAYALEHPEVGAILAAID
jgi:antirestriction protein